jgi:hypothetical protein
VRKIGSAESKVFQKTVREYAETVARERTAANATLPALEEQEAALKKVLQQLPISNIPRLEWIRREMYVMKDRVRETKKAIRSLGRRSEAAGAALFKPGPLNWLAAFRIIKSQGKIVGKIVDNIEKLNKSKAKLRDTLKTFPKPSRKKAR